MDRWEQIKDRLRTKVTLEAYQNWFAQTRLRADSSTGLEVAVPSDECRQWLEGDFAPAISEAAGEAGMAGIRMNFVGVLAGAVEPVATNGHSTVVETNGLSYASSVSQLNHRYTFDTFVVGSCNQFAHAAAKAVVDQPGRTYNPLFIYGGAGMGKTHLIHAIAHEFFRRAGTTFRMVYTTGERFVNHVVQSIRTDRMPLFHQYYRSADILLVDDVHTVAGKDRTEEEFFHTFNDLYDHQKQIVLTSDLLPKNMPNLIARLRSRFGWGLLVDVQAPDLETKLAILDKKAEMEGVHLPAEVRNHIAAKIKSSVRELEGALVRLIAFSSVTGSSITLDMAKQNLRHLAVGGERRITIEAVIKAVADRYNLLPAQLKQKSNRREFALPRQVAMYITKELTTASLPEIGRAFGGKHHTTVLHSIQKIARDRLSDPDLNRLIHSIIDSFN